MHGRSSVRKGRTRTSSFNFTTGGPVSDARWRKIARALWKTTLELAYLDHGEMVYEERFNEVCAMVAGTKQASGFLLFPKDSGPPNSEVSVTYQFQEVLGQPAMNSTTVIAGVPFITDLFLRRLDPVDRVILRWRYNIVEF